MSIAHRHAKERFSWLADTWDIAALWRDIDEGRLAVDGEQLQSTRMDDGFIAAYAQKVLCLDRSYSMDAPCMSMFIQMDLRRAMALPEQALESPVLLLNIGRDSGMLQLQGHASPRHVLADGNHRIAKAFMTAQGSIPALIASEEVSARYLIDSPAMRQERRRSMPMQRRPR